MYLLILGINLLISDIIRNGINKPLTAQLLMYYMIIKISLLPIGLSTLDNVNAYVHLVRIRTSLNL